MTGPAAAAGLAEADLERLRKSAEVAAVQLRAYALDAKNESALVRGLPLLSPSPGAGVRFVRLSGDVRKKHLFLLEGLGGRLPLGEGGTVRPRPGQRAALGRTEGAGARLAGLEAGVRAWPADRPDERSLWIDLAVKLAAQEAPAREPEAKVSLAPGTALLFVGLPNPFSDPGGRARLAVWVELAE